LIRSLSIVLVCLVLIACNPFKPRAAEKPDSESDWSAFPVTTVEVEQNLLLAYQVRQNLSRYDELFASDYLFLPDPQDQNAYDLPTSWGRTMEQQSLTGLWSRIPSSVGMTLNMILDPDRDDEVLAASARLYRTYSLSLPTGTGFTAQEYAGRCCLYLEVHDGLWSIVKWYDYRTGDAPTWGKLKYDAAP
jgi:hypothetical protein